MVTTFLLTKPVLQSCMKNKKIRNNIPCSLQNMETVVRNDNNKYLRHVAHFDDGSQETLIHDDRRNKCEYSRSARPTILKTGSTCTGCTPNIREVEKLRKCDSFFLVPVGKWMKILFKRK